MTTTQRPIDQRRLPNSRRRPLGEPEEPVRPGHPPGGHEDSFVKLNPRTMARNPVMFVVEVGSVLTTILFFRDSGRRRPTRTCSPARGAVAVVHGAVRQLRRGHGRGPGQGAGGHVAQDPRRDRRQGAPARRHRREGPQPLLQLGDLCVVVAGELIPGDGDVVEGIATVDESAITGESAPVIRESGGDRSAVTGGTRVLSDEIIVRITSKPGETFLDRMIALVEGASRQKTPNEIALTILLAGLTIIFLLAVVTLQPFAIYSGAEQSIIVLVALLVCLIPTTIGGAAVGHRHRRHGPPGAAQRAPWRAGRRGRRRRRPGLLDKTGTITFGSRQAAEFVPVSGREASWPRPPCCRAWPTRRPRGAPSWSSAKERYGLPRAAGGAVLVPFTAQTRMSGVFIEGRGAQGGRRFGQRYCRGAGRHGPAELDAHVEGIAKHGGTPLAVVGERPGPRRDPPQGHREAGYAGALRRAAGHGHPHGDDHGRQPADGARPSPRRRASTTSWPRPRPRTRWP